MSLFDFLQRPIAFHPAIARMLGDVPAALMLSQAIYWTKKLNEDRGGWFYKTAVEWEEETTLTSRQQERARRILRGAGEFWQERLEGLPARLWFRVDESELERKLVGLLVSPIGETSFTASAKQRSPRGDSTNTTEITPQTTVQREMERLELTAAAAQHSEPLRDRMALDETRRLADCLPADVALAALKACTWPSQAVAALSAATEACRLKQLELQYQSKLTAPPAKEQDPAFLAGHNLMQNIERRRKAKAGGINV